MIIFILQMGKLRLRAFVCVRVCLQGILARVWAQVPASLWGTLAGL